MSRRRDPDGQRPRVLTQEQIEEMQHRARAQNARAAGREARAARRRQRRQGQS